MSHKRRSFLKRVSHAGEYVGLRMLDAVVNLFPYRSLDSCAGILVTIFWLLYIQSMPMLFVFSIVHGLTFGGHNILRPLLVANHFGRAHLGAVNGLMRPFFTLSGAVSPLLVVGLYDAYGSYYWAFFAVMVAWFAASVMLRLGVPARAPAEQRAVVAPGP